MTAVCISVLLWPPFQHTSPENLNLIEMLEILLRVMIAYHHHHVLLFSVSQRLILERVWLLFCSLCAFWIRARRITSKIISKSIHLMKVKLQVFFFFYW